jgi:DNA-binding NtrC family response regulator
MAKNVIITDGGRVPGNDIRECLSDAGPRWIAVLFDEKPDRRELVREIVKQGGGGVQRLDGYGSPTENGLSDQVLVFLGVVDLWSNPIRQLAWMTQWRVAGAKVIAYTEGIKQWSIRSKCLLIQAGAMCLLDSASPTFTSELRRIVSREREALADVQREEEELRTVMRMCGMVGDSIPLRAAFRSAMRFSELSDLPVLITGESGTGKELIARAIYKMDPKRKAGPLVSINCAALTPGLIESELFGHRRGAFTGADRDRRGLIRSAERGVFFLDEIGELDFSLQGKLLRVLQENCLQGLGEEHEVAINVRFIAATNRNLEQLVGEQKFRADLYHRLRVLHLEIPALRERAADLPLLIDYFLEKHSVGQKKFVTGVSRDFHEAIHQIALPGNVRQLENIIRESLANHNHRTGTEIGLNDLPSDILNQLAGTVSEGQPSKADLAPEKPCFPFERSTPKTDQLLEKILDSQGWNLSKTLQECERRVFQAALARSEGNQSKVARLLGVTPRCVYNKMRKYDFGSGIF